MGSELPSPAQSPDIGRDNFFDSGFTPTLYVNMRSFIGSNQVATKLMAVVTAVMAPSCGARMGVGCDRHQS
jgi:hypothetical protein